MSNKYTFEIRLPDQSILREIALSKFSGLGCLGLTPSGPPFCFRGLFLYKCIGKVRKRAIFVKIAQKTTFWAFKMHFFLRLTSSLHLQRHFKVHLENHVTIWESPGGQKGGPIGAIWTYFNPFRAF